MQGLDIELERQQADEELTQLLGELVVKPLHSQLGERLQSELFTFGEKLDSKLRQQLAPLGKSRDLKRSFEELEQSLEDGLRLLQQQQRDLGSQLADAKQANSQCSEALQTRVQALAGQVTAAEQSRNDNHRQLHGQLSAQLQQQALALHEQLTKLNQADREHVAALQVSLQSLAGQVTADQQSLNDNHRQLHGQLSAQLQQQAQALREQLLDKQEQGTQSLLDRLQQQSTTQQDQLQRVHAELSAMQHLPHEVVKLQKQAASEQQQVSGLLQQQQALLAQQQKEVQRLRRALSTFAWTGLVLGGLSCAGIALLVLHTPAIRTLLD
ncbi:hypothetical protein [Comamonas sp. wu1-DMT]|uniref:hypothetical protein n=1 Tax=Comamonas sp. wu1-DMT TaxID=3126390 RepID=UPI0032E5017D